MERHRVLLPAWHGELEWIKRGRNLPVAPGDPGTPDIYAIPRFAEQGGNILEIEVDLWNVSQADQAFTLNVEVHQGDYVPDVLFDEQGTLAAQDNNRHLGFGVFVPLGIMQ